jgi:hypothetical protein
MNRPDIIICRFPTTGEGGHGHHTASAILAQVKLVIEKIKPGFCSWNRDERKKGNKDGCLSRYFGRKHNELC